MENEKNDNKMCEWCGRHMDGRYMWLRLVLAVLIGVFIFLAGIQIGEMRAEVYGYHGGRMMQWQHQDGMMMDNNGMDGQQGTTTIVVPANPTVPATTTSATAPAAAPVAH